MSESGYFYGDTGETYYVKPLPITTPWGDDDIAGVETGTTGWFVFAALDEETPYAVYLQAGGSPADSDEFQVALEASRVDLVDAPNSSAVAAIQDGLSTLDTDDIDARLEAYDAPTKEELDTAQSAIEAACATVTTTQIRTALSGTWTDEDGNTFELTVTETA